MQLNRPGNQLNNRVAERNSNGPVRTSSSDSLLLQDDKPIPFVNVLFGGKLTATKVSNFDFVRSTDVSRFDCASRTSTVCPRDSMARYSRIYGWLEQTGNSSYCIVARLLTFCSQLPCFYLIRVDIAAADSTVHLTGSSAISTAGHFALNIHYNTLVFAHHLNTSSKDNSLDSHAQAFDRHVLRCVSIIPFIADTFLSFRTLGCISCEPCK